MPNRSRMASSVLPGAHVPMVEMTPVRTSALRVSHLQHAALYAQQERVSDDVLEDGSNELKQKAEKFQLITTTYDPSTIFVSDLIKKTWNQATQEDDTYTDTCKPDVWDRQMKTLRTNCPSIYNFLILRDFRSARGGIEDEIEELPLTDKSFALFLLLRTWSAHRANVGISQAISGTIQNNHVLTELQNGDVECALEKFGIVLVTPGDVEAITKKLNSDWQTLLFFPGRTRGPNNGTEMEMKFCLLQFWCDRVTGKLDLNHLGRLANCAKSATKQVLQGRSNGTPSAQQMYKFTQETLAYAKDVAPIVNAIFQNFQTDAISLNDPSSKETKDIEKAVNQLRVMFVKSATTSTTDGASKHARSFRRRRIRVGRGRSASAPEDTYDLATGMMLTSKHRRRSYKKQPRKYF